MASQSKPESKLAEATDRTTALLQGLQSRLNREPAPAASAPAREETREDTPEDLDRQLQEYFVTETEKSSHPAVLDQIRERVIQAVADRILESWERGDRHELGALEHQVIDRVAERILERMSRR